MRRLAGFFVLGMLAIFVLSACSSSDDEKSLSETQKYYFLESLKLVEQAGRRLQVENKTQLDIRQALAIMDRGLKLAFEVENEFLKKLDVRLGKNYQRYFVKGVEDYRLGIEAGDREQQQNGLRLLAQWAEFWTVLKPAVDVKLHPQ